MKRKVFRIRSKFNPKKEMVPCPMCHKPNACKRSKILFEDENKREIKKLLSENFFHFKCKHCGASGDLVYDVIYIDANKKLAIQLVSKRMAKYVAESIGESIKGKNRVVTDHEIFREKVLIFRNDLDDRVIEFVKVLFAKALNIDSPDYEYSDILFDIDTENNFVILFLNEKGLPPLGVEMTMHDYFTIKNMYADILEKDENREIFVDYNWAFNAINKNSQEKETVDDN